MLKRLVAGVLLVTILNARGAELAPAADVECPGGTILVAGVCVIQVAVPADSEGGAGDGDGRMGGERRCYSGPVEVSCVSTWGYWDASRGCYVEPASPQPPFSDAAWEGHTDGLIYNCTSPGGSRNWVIPFWSPAVPVTIDPAVLAAQLRASMTFNPVAIGIVPEPGPDRMGLVGLPTWLWVQNPGPTTLGPQTRSLGAGGVTVTLTAKVTSTRREMGNGAVVDCATAGTPYEDRFGVSESPTCGYRYTKQGAYTVRALTNWTATWRANTGEQGVFTWQVGSATTINMGEAQVINR